MTLLRRTPREVYRVYGEEEFWANAERELLAADEELATPHSGGRSALRRIVASGALLTALGAFGAVVALTRFPTASRDAPGRSSKALVATGSLASSPAAQTHIWQSRQPPSVGAHTAGRARTADASRRASSQPATAIPPAEDDTTVSVQVSDDVRPRAVAAVSESPASREQSEFGFER
jgi:hypothetical protein